MTTFAVPNVIRFAYLSVLEFDEVGHLGGLLVIDQRGRPIEFHCTSPVEVSRAQQILFGSTMTSHIYADCIGKALVDRIRQPPELVFIRQSPLRDLAAQIDLPIVFVPSEPPADLETPPAALSSRLEVVGQAEPAARIVELVGQLSQYVDPHEPFERIAEAIGEAHQLTSPPDEEEAHAA